MAVDCYYTMSRFFCKLHRDMNRVNVFAIHRCINEGYGLIQIFTEKIRISPTKLWRVCSQPIQTPPSGPGRIYTADQVLIWDDPSVTPLS